MKADLGYCTKAGPGRQTIRANVPEADILRYSTELRSMTGGRGSYAVKFDPYLLSLLRLDCARLPYIYS